MSSFEDYKKSCLNLLDNLFWKFGLFCCNKSINDKHIKDFKEKIDDIVKAVNAVIKYAPATEAGKYKEFKRDIEELRTDDLSINRTLSFFKNEIEKIRKGRHANLKRINDAKTFRRFLENKKRQREHDEEIMDRYYGPFLIRGLT